MNKYNNAVSIVKRLKENGHETYFVGGWVRDKLLKTVNEDCDIDLATSCLIQDVPKLFSDAIYVGQAFGVCIVKVKSDDEYYQFDLATFRLDGLYEDGRHPNIIKTTTVEEDAKRRDFTINAIYYDPIEDKYLDFVGGKKDLEDKVIRAVGNPYERFKEDKLRMLRAVRLSCQLNFEIDEKIKEAIRDLASELLPAVSYERIWQELDKTNKNLKRDDFYDYLSYLGHLGLLSQFFPEVKEWNGIWWEGAEDAIKSLPTNTPTLIKIMAFLGTFEEKKVLEIVKRFNLKKPNWLTTWKQ